MLDQSETSKWLHTDLCFYLSHQQFCSFLSLRMSGCSFCFLSETSCHTSPCALHLHRCLIHLRWHRHRLRWHGCSTFDFDDTASTRGGRSHHCSAMVQLHLFEGAVSCFLDAASSFLDIGHYFLDDAPTHSSNLARLLLAPASMVASSTLRACSSQPRWPSSTVGRHGGAAAALKHGAAASTTVASTPTEARLQSGLGGGELGSGLTIDLSGVTTTCSDGRWLLLPHYVANGGLLPLRLDLGLEGSDSG
jgi:hypothetical protein